MPVTFPETIENVAARPDDPGGPVEVYGQDHSPWVQAVLLGLYEKEIPHTVTTVPSPALFARAGILMPAAKIGPDPWIYESTDILARLGYSGITSDEKKALFGAWRGVSHRTDRAFRFWHRFSLIRDPAPSSLRRLRNHFLRSFGTFYFFWLITFLKRTDMGVPLDDYADSFRYWENRLRSGAAPFLGGAEPDTLDLVLFGIVQCHTSIPVPPIRALQTAPGLSRVRAWIGAMQERFTDYPHLYSGVYFEPRRPAPARNGTADRIAFWSGAACMFLLWPITLPLVLLLAWRVRRLRTAT